MADDSRDGQRQCRRGVTVDVELDAAMALADMAGVGPAPAAGGGDPHQPRAAPPVQHRAAPPPPPPPQAAEDEEEELASTRLSLELGKVGIQSSAASPCSSTSSAGGHHPHPQPPPHDHHHHVPTLPATGYGPRPRHMLTEAEKEAKRLRRVLANRESARQTILRRQAIRDELARKVTDLSSQNENMKKEKDMVMQEYLSLKEANKHLKEQVARTTKKAPAATAVTARMPMHVAAPAAAQQQAAEAMVATTASPPATPPQPGFLYTAAPPGVPYVWGSWPPGAGYEYHHGGSPPGPPPLCLPPCAWYYPVVADPRGSPSAYPPPPQQQQQQQVAFQPEPAGRGGAGSPADGATVEEDTNDDPCSLTLGLDVADKRSAPVDIDARGGGAGPSDRDKAATAAEARKRRKELTKLKHMHAAGRPGGE